MVAPVGDFRIGGVEHAHVLETELDPRRDDLRLLVGDERSVGVFVPAGGGDDDEVLLGPAGQLDELLVDAGAVEVAASDDYQSAFRRSVFRLLLRRRKGRRNDEGDDGE
jgi:hypothetical protein